MASKGDYLLCDLDSITCKKCKKEFRYRQADTWWDYSLMSYDLKLVSCPNCKTIGIVDVKKIEKQDDYF
mgnify:CR=1 FL=1